MQKSQCKLSAATGQAPGDWSAVDWGVNSGTGRLCDVLLCPPNFLSMVPCNAVTRNSIASGLSSSVDLAQKQHEKLAEALIQFGVRSHFVDPVADLADMTFTRDAVLMSPWGLIELRPAVPHRSDEVARVSAALTALGAPYLGRVDAGTIEGGDVCLLREGVVLIGCSGERTNDRGARALASLFEDRGWEVIHTRFDPEHLHLDTIFTMVSDTCAVACTKALDPTLLEHLRRIGIWLLPASPDEARNLGSNLLSVGENRLIVPADNSRLNRVLKGCGFDIAEVEIDQFTRCGGGIHCLTLPLARQTGHESMATSARSPTMLQP